jgi:hypothetical protein
VTGYIHFEIYIYLIGTHELVAEECFYFYLLNNPFCCSHLTSVTQVEELKRQNSCKFCCYPACVVNEAQVFFPLESRTFFILLQFNNNNKILLLAFQRRIHMCVTEAAVAAEVHWKAANLLLRRKSESKRQMLRAPTSKNRLFQRNCPRKNKSKGPGPGDTYSLRCKSNIPRPFLGDLYVNFYSIYGQANSVRNSIFSGGLCMEISIKSHVVLVLLSYSTTAAVSRKWFRGQSRLICLEEKKRQIARKAD